MRYGKPMKLMRLAVALSGTREGFTLDEIAADYEVSHRTAERMIAALKEIFPQVEAVPGDGRSLRWRLPQNAIRGVLAPDAIELHELEVAAQRLRLEGAADGRAQTLESLAAKVRAALRPELLRKTETDTAALMEAEGTAIRPGPRPNVAEPILKAVRDALLKSHRVRMVYQSKGAPPPGRERIVEPLGVLHGQRPYLVAAFVDRGFEPSVFRLDRIASLDILPVPFTRPLGFDLQAFAARSFGVWQEDPIAVTLRFTGTAAEEALHFHFHPTQVRTPQADGSVIVTFTAGGRLEMMQHFSTWGTLIEIVGPASLRKEMAGWCSSLGAHHTVVQYMPDRRNSC